MSKSFAAADRRRVCLTEGSPRFSDPARVVSARYGRDRAAAMHPIVRTARARMMGEGSDASLHERVHGHQREVGLLLS